MRGDVTSRHVPETGGEGACERSKGDGAYPRAREMAHVPEQGEEGCKREAASCHRESMSNTPKNEQWTYVVRGGRPVALCRMHDNVQREHDLHDNTSEGVAVSVMSHARRHEEARQPAHMTTCRSRRQCHAMFQGGTQRVCVSAHTHGESA
jgi:hypothetical protein